MAAGLLVYDLGLVWLPLSLPGTMLSALGLLLAVAVLLRVTFRGQGAREHALLVLFTLALGVVGLGLHGLALQGLGWSLAGGGRRAGCLVFPVASVFIVLHRMLPFSRPR